MIDKSLIARIAQPLEDIFNRSFSIGVFPELLKIAKVIPIFKPDDRFVSVLPLLSNYYYCYCYYYYLMFKL